MNLKVRAKRRSYMYATVLFLACLVFPLIGCGKRVYGAFGFCGGRGEEMSDCKMWCTTLIFM